MDRPARQDRLLDLSGVVESVLPAALLAQLPASTPGPPWDCRVRAVVWVQRGAPPLPASSPWAGRVLPVTVGAVVDYLDSPVGRYREVLAGPLLRRRGRPVVHVPFMAVDSLPSVHGGRTHWGLPKSLAGFEGEVAAGDVTATGDGWSLALRTTGRGVPVPVLATFGSEQVAGRAEVVVRGRGRATLVRVAAEGPTLTGWLGTGVHAGAVGTGRLVVRPPR